MQDEKDIRKSAFVSVRLILYTAFFVNGLVQYISPFPNLCEYEGYSCAFCGMRKAVDFSTLAANSRMSFMGSQAQPEERSIRRESVPGILVGDGRGDHASLAAAQLHPSQRTGAAVFLQCS